MNHGLDTDAQVFFYEQDFYVLSNFSAFRLSWQGWGFDTSEAAYHWEKFPNAREVRESIRFATSAHEAFKVAERYKAVRRPDWDAVKVRIMKAILVEKALQHEYVRRKLLATGDRELIENSWRDDFWGWGPNRDGKNMLGKLWMEVRNELRRSTPTVIRERDRRLDVKSPETRTEPTAQPGRCKSMQTVQCQALVGHDGDHLHNLVGWRDEPSPVKTTASRVHQNCPTCQCSEPE